MRLILALSALLLAVPATVSAATWTFRFSLAEVYDMPYMPGYFASGPETGSLTFDPDDIGMAYRNTLRDGHVACSIGRMNCADLGMTVSLFDRLAGKLDATPIESDTAMSLRFDGSGRGSFFYTCDCGPSDAGYFRLDLHDVRYIADVPLPASAWLLLGALGWLFRSRLRRAVAA